MDIRILFVLAFIAFRIYRGVMANRQRQTDGMSDLSPDRTGSRQPAPPTPSGEPLAPQPRPTDRTANQMNPMRQTRPTAPRVEHKRRSSKRDKDDPFRGMNDPTGGSGLTIDDIVT